MKNELHTTLRRFGVTRRYKGFDLVVYSVSLAASDDMRLMAVTKDIYMKTADHFGCTWTAVERNIRTVASHAWQVNPEFMREIAGYPLADVPTNAEFLEILTSYVTNNYKDPIHTLD